MNFCEFCKIPNSTYLGEDMFRWRAVSENWQFFISHSIMSLEVQPKWASRKQKCSSRQVKKIIAKRKIFEAVAGN